MINILDSETFYYGSDVHKTHQGRHTILRKLLPGLSIFEEGQVLLTVCDDTYYIWKGSGGRGISWSQWCQFDLGTIEARYLQEEEELPNIDLGHGGFVGTSHGMVADLGTEIEIIPRRCEIVGHCEKWTVDLVIPTGTETVIFHVYGPERIKWFNERAILDSKMTIALKKFEFTDATIQS